MDKAPQSRGGVVSLGATLHEHFAGEARCGLLWRPDNLLQVAKGVGRFTRNGHEPFEATMGYQASLRMIEGQIEILPLDVGGFGIPRPTTQKEQDQCLPADVSNVLRGRRE